MVKHAADELGNTVNYLSHRLGLRWSLVLTPWRLAWRWLSLYLSFLLELCAIAGAAPSGYMTKNQVEQAAANMHAQLMWLQYSRYSCLIMLGVHCTVELGLLHVMMHTGVLQLS